MAAGGLGGHAACRLSLSPKAPHWPAPPEPAASHRLVAAAQGVAAAEVATRVVVAAVGAVVVTAAVKAEVMAVEAVGGTGVAR